MTIFINAFLINLDVFFRKISKYCFYLTTVNVDGLKLTCLNA